ncbi:hypothetical protein DFS34DRAFT_668366 [Phlyctochytrium arcticum]|nr:hypothetical protein DFS34DRAFT_668366 [Phlyctochytrium arcticum]
MAATAETLMASAKQRRTASRPANILTADQLVLGPETGPDPDPLGPPVTPLRIHPRATTDPEGVDHNPFSDYGHPLSSMELGFPLRPSQTAAIMQLLTTDPMRPQSPGDYPAEGCSQEPPAPQWAKRGSHPFATDTPDISYLRTAGEGCLTGPENARGSLALPHRRNVARGQGRQEVLRQDYYGFDRIRRYARGPLQRTYTDDLKEYQDMDLPAGVDPILLSDSEDKETSHPRVGRGVEEDDEA